MIRLWYKTPQREKDHRRDYRMKLSETSTRYHPQVLMKNNAAEQTQKKTSSHHGMPDKFVAAVYVRVEHRKIYIYILFV